MNARRVSLFPGRPGSRSRAALFVVSASLAAGVAVGPACAARSSPSLMPTIGAPMARGGAARALQRDLAATFDAESFARTTWAVLVQSLDRGDVLYARNPGMLVMPASNMKIVTLATAAETLGWDHRFETRVLAAGPIAGGVLAGDLVVVGGGDPSINSRDGAASRVFDEWARRLHESGVTRIAGRIIGDGRAFSGEPLGQGWAWDYLGYGYAAPVSALQYDENLAELAVSPGAAAGAPATIAIRPAECALEVDGAVATGPEGSPVDLDIQRAAGSNRVVVTGSVPAGAKETVRTVAVADPATAFAGNLRRALIERGIEVGGTATAIEHTSQAPDTASARLLFVHQSPPLSEVATVLMKVSQNLYAETLLRALGMRRGAGTVAEGRKAVAEVLTAWGVPSNAYLVADGSGLSRYNYLSAEAIVRILMHIHGDARHRDLFIATLPVAGQDGGTIARRMKGTAAEGNAKAKTGSIANVRALSGFVTTRGGERVVFSILANSFSVAQSAVDDATDKAVVRLAEFRR